MTVLETVAFDIETTGFELEDEITVAGFDSNAGSRVFLNTGKSGRSREFEQKREREHMSPQDLERRLNDVVSSSITLTSHATEMKLLEAIHTFVQSTLTPRSIKLVAFNGETWNGGFDLPFLRTRLSHHGLVWPFVDLPYIDVMDVFMSRFNTRTDTLDGVYGELIGGDLSGLDPFETSAEAVDAWESGDFERLCLHNVADIRRTRALMALAEEYCSKSDFSMKSLDPVV